MPPKFTVRLSIRLISTKSRTRLINSIIIMRNEDLPKENIQGKATEQPSRNVQRKFLVDDFDEKAIFLCQFCGGEGCDQQNFLKNKIQPNAVDGLHSNWITDQILAMQRPSERLIKEFKIYAKFKELNIRTVLNLQEPGEHPYCGDGIIPNVGFSYIPENFYYHGIHCFNESWEDMTATTFEHMMKIMNLFDMSLADGGKISVHCHAGRGRTLLVICSWLIYNDRMKAKDTIQLAVAKRQGVLTRSSQREFLQYFEQELAMRWISFGVDSDFHSFSEYVEWQTLSLLNRQKKILNSTAILHCKAMTGLRKLLNRDQQGVIQSWLSPFNLQFKVKWGEQQEKHLQLLKNQININHFDKLLAIEDPRLLSQLLFDFYEQFPSTLVTSITVDCLMQQLQKQAKQSQKLYLKIFLQPAIVHNLGLSSFAVIMDFVHLLKQISVRLSKSIHKSQVNSVEDQKINQEIIKSLFLRLSMLLLSKKKYFPQLFPSKTPRDCKLIKYSSKIAKIVNTHVIFLADFLRKLSEQLPQQQEQLHRLIFKAHQVDANLYYLTKQSPNNILGQQQKKQIYDSARIKNTH